MTETVTAPASGRVAVIPERTRITGRLTARALRRTTIGFAILWCGALAPTVLGWAPAWKAFGLGLLFPGAGFLYTSDPVFFALTLAALPYLAFMFQMRADNVRLPVLVLATSAAAAARVHTGLWDWALWVVPLVLAALVVTILTGRRRAFTRSRARGATRNVYLRTASRPAAPSTPAVPELSDDELALQRSLLDRALQPPDQWAGFDWVQQFSMAAMRYQLCWMQWALVAAQARSTPAFTGYVSEAQRGLIERMTDRRVWSYWRVENLLGNLDANPDPIRRDNIMLSGYYGLMLGLYATTTGDRRYEQAGCLEFRWNGRRSFAYDHTSIVDALVRNADNEWGAFPCEPGLNFAGCNVLGLSALVSWDRLAGTAVAPPLLERFHRSLTDEYTAADGDIITIISRRYGYSMRFVRSTVAQAGTAFFLSPLAPEIAARQWEVLRHEGLSLGKPVGPKLDEVDLGNSKRSPATRLAYLLALAKEVGDDETARSLEEQAADELDWVRHDGAGWYGACSNYANASLALGRFGGRDVWRRLIAGNGHGVAAPGASPRLAAAGYPDVLVARAVADGRALDLVLRPGAGGGRVELVVDGLEPGQPYAVAGGVGEAVIADAGGEARVQVDLGGRQVVRVEPANRMGS